jgi:stage II sporulation protein D
MSTCGGATENVEAMFEGSAAPYLKSTECVLESEESWTLRAGRTMGPLFVDGRNVSPKLAMMAALGVIAPGPEIGWFGEPAASDEAADWVRKAAEAVGRKMDGTGPPPAGPLTLLGFARMVTETFGWEDRVRMLVGKSEAEHVTRDWLGLAAEDRPLAAYFLTSGVFPSALVPTEERSPVLTRAEAAVCLARLIDLSRDPFRQGNVKGILKTGLLVGEDDRTVSLEIAPEAYLLRSMEGSAAFAPSLEVGPGDVVRWIESEGRVRLLQVQSAPLTNVLDQPSQYHSWQVRTSREDMEVRINQFYPVGKLVDLVPQKRGASKRVIELSVIGRESQVRLTGMRIRQVLNLRDNLFVIDRESDEEGRVTHFLFSGKGWGHGVGMCQVGAFGMARKGATYDAILKKYYRGIALEKMY